MAIPARQMKWILYRDMYLTASGKDEFSCHYCSRIVFREHENLKMKVTLDHVVPTSKGGGRYDFHNLVPACFNCNRKKGDLTVEEFVRMMLSKKLLDKNVAKYLREKFCKSLNCNPVEQEV